MAAVNCDQLVEATNSAVEEAINALGPLSRELGVAAGLENPAVPMVVALDLLPQIVPATHARARAHPTLAADEPVAVHASVLAGLIVLLADALLTAVLEITDQPQTELLASA